MSRLGLLVLFASAACQTTSAPPAAPQPQPAEARAPVAPAPRAASAVRPDPRPLFPPAREGFTLKGDDRGGPTLAQALDALEKATGVQFLASDPVRGMLTQVSCGVRGDLVVPAASAWPLIETLLVQNEFLLNPVHRGEPFLVAVQSLSGGQTDLRLNAIQVEVGDLDRYREHQALLVTTVVDVSPIDARMLATSLRQMFPDQRTMSILPISGAQLILAGWAPSVASMTRQLETAAALEREHPAVALPKP
jgi:hypothetical protein